MLLTPRGYVPFQAALDRVAAILPEQERIRSAARKQLREALANGDLVAWGQTENGKMVVASEAERWRTAEGNKALAKGRVTVDVPLIITTRDLCPGGQTTVASTVVVEID